MSAHCNTCGSDLVHGFGEDWQLMGCQLCEARADLAVERQAREKAERDAAIKDRAMTDYFAEASCRAEAAERRELTLESGRLTLMARAQAAEAERDRLADALRATTDPASSWNIGLPAYRIARLKHFVDAALAAAGSGGTALQLDPRFPHHVEGCVCPRFRDIAPNLIADLTCPIHGIQGSDPGDVLADAGAGGNIEEPT